MPQTTSLDHVLLQQSPTPLSLAFTTPQLGIEESCHIGRSGGESLPDQMTNMNNWQCSTSHLEVLGEEQSVNSRVLLE